VSAFENKNCLRFKTEVELRVSIREIDKLEASRRPPDQAITGLPRRIRATP
jgi:hypothetical protein